MLAELGEGGVYLDRCRSGPHGEAGLSLKGRTPSVGLRPGSLAPPQRKVCRPQPNGKNYLGTLVGTGCPLLPPCQGPLPLLSWGICLAHLPSLTLPRHPPPPEASAAGGNSPRAWERSISLMGNLLREKQAPALQAHPASQGAPRPLTTGGEGQSAHGPD